MWIGEQIADSQVMRARAAVWLILLASCVCLQAQVCPTENGDATTPSTLHGKIVYHDGLRGWIGFKLDKPECDQNEIELVFLQGDGLLHWRQAKTLSGCRATVKGALRETVSGYYSAPIYIGDPTINVDPGCTPKPLEPDLSKVKVPSSVNFYSAKVTIDYRGAGHADVVAYDSQGHHLSPWQAYVSYSFNAPMDLIWFQCAEGFKLHGAKRFPKEDDIRHWGGLTGTGLDQDKINVVTYTCTREK